MNDHLVPGLPSGVNSIEDGFAHGTDHLIYPLISGAQGLTEAAAPLALPPIHSLHLGVGLGVDGRLYLLKPTPQLIDGITNVVSVTSGSVTFMNRQEIHIHALTASGHRHHAVFLPTSGTPPIISSRGQSFRWLRAPPNNIFLGADEVVWHMLGEGVSAHYAAAGPVKVFEMDELPQRPGTDERGARVVTRLGEVWSTARLAQDDGTRFDVATPDPIVPSGKKAISLHGKYVWLDDGVVVFRGDATGEVRELDVQGVAPPNP